MRRTKYVQDVMARTGLSGNRILAAIAVQAECILEIQHLCIAGYFPVVDDQWYLWDLPEHLQQEVADAADPRQKLVELKRKYRDEFRRRRTVPLNGVWEGKEE